MVFPEYCLESDHICVPPNILSLQYDSYHKIINIFALKIETIIYFPDSTVLDRWSWSDGVPRIGKQIFARYVIEKNNVHRESL